jgi:hypothetical protein
MKDVHIGNEGALPPELQRCLKAGISFDELTQIESRIAWSVREASPFMLKLSSYASQSDAKPPSDCELEAAIRIAIRLTDSARKLRTDRMKNVVGQILWSIANLPWHGEERKVVLLITETCRSALRT